jgi:uncharacterized membrane protein YczE
MSTGRGVRRQGASRPWPLAARITQLLAGQVAYGVSIAFQVRARLGLDPWDVLHQGLSRRTGLAIGTCIVLVGALVLGLWIPLRQRLGVGTVSNVIVIGVSVDAVLGFLPTPHVIGLRFAYLGTGILLCGIATGAYIGAGLGPGPRDGLMVGLARRGHSVRMVRTAIEVSVMAVGYLLGGTVGIGTVLFALGIGPIVHLTLPFFSHAAHRRGECRPVKDLECSSG